MNQAEATKTVQDMSEQRAAAAAVPYTIADAIKDAQFYRANPGCVIDTAKLKKVADTLLSGLEQSRCYFNAVQRGQRTFVLVEQDQAAPAAIRAWAEAAETHGCGTDKVNHAYRTAREWSEAPNTANGMTKKWPD